MTETLLVLSTPSGLPVYSARGLTQTLEPIEQSAQLDRTVNGVLVDLSLSQFRKYKSTISCSDMRSPRLDGVWPGQTLTVDCVQELSYPTAGAPTRTAVADSTRTEGPMKYYRPQLTMKVTGFQLQTDEWQATVGWTLDLEEA